MKIYLENREEKLYEISVDEFIKKSKKFVDGQLNKSEAIKVLGQNLKEISDSIENNSGKIIVSETRPSQSNHNYDYSAIYLLQEFIVFFSSKLNDVLCGKTLNPKYIKVTGNPGYCDISIYAFKKLNGNLIIKSFLFASLPKEDELFISTTCGTGGTAVLFEALKNLIVDKSFFESQNNKIKYMHLESVENANTIRFYSKLGFYKTNKDSNKILKDMIKSVYKKDLLYDEYIKKSDLDIGGSLYWSNDSKVLKKLKCSYEYYPELWYKNINKFKKDKLPKSEVLNFFYSKYQDLKGAGIPEEHVDHRRDKQDGYELHAVVVNKNKGLEEAMTESKNFINDDRNFYRETKSSFRFRNIPKQKFQKKSFRSKKINPDVTLIYGKLI
jgi:hypothetical protein